MAFKAIRLDSGSGLSATFVPGAGMICVSLAFEGREYLAQRGGLGEYVASGSTMGIPILYPWANRLARDSWKFGQRPARIDPGAYRVKRDENGLAIHGTLAASPFWKVGEASADDDMTSARVRATLEFGDHPELLSTFPFPHRLELEFGLSGRRLSVRTSVTPTGDFAVPLAYGFHPYLTLPGSDRDSWEVSLPAMTSLETDSRQIPTGNSSPVEANRFSLADRDLDDAFTGVAEAAEFWVADESTRLTVELKQGFNAAQVYSPRDSDFICFEPMKAPTNALISGRDLTSVEPGQTDVAEFTIEIGEPVGPEEDTAEEAEPEVPAAVNTTSVRPAFGASEPGRERVMEARYRLGPGDPVEEVRRVAQGRVDSAVSSLRRMPSENRADAIHTARKDMKKLRAVLTLVRGELGKKAYRRESSRFRDAAKQLSESRDAEVLAGTLASVLEDYPEGAPPVDRLVADLDLRRHSVSASADDASLDETIDRVADEIEAGGEHIPGWPLEGSDWSLFEGGLTRSYRGGRKALAATERHSADQGVPERDDVHALRKRVKELWYALRLFQDAWPEGLAGPTAAADDLAEILGDYNDLSVLLDEIERRPSQTEDLSVLSATILDRQSGLLDRALPIARRLYAEEPEAFTARLGAYWSAQAD